MAYRVFWSVPQQILCLELEGNLSIDDFHQINQAVLDHLGDEKLERPMTLLVDITRPGTAPRAVEQLRVSQTYLRRYDLKCIWVAGTNKLMRLMILLTFNLCRPSLRFFDNLEQALTIAQRTNILSQEPSHASQGNSG